MLYQQRTLFRNSLLRKVRSAQTAPCGFHEYDIGIIGFEIDCVLSLEENEVSMN